MVVHLFRRYNPDQRLYNADNLLCIFYVSAFIGKGDEVRSIAKNCR